MDVNLRDAIISNIQNKSKEQLMDMMETATREKEEKTLPGLGVIFEVIWENSDSNVKESLISTLDQHI